MKTITVSATDLKNDTSTLLQLVRHGQATVIVEWHGSPIAKIVQSDTKIEKKTLTKKLEKLAGSVPSFPEIHKNRATSDRQEINFD